MQRETGQAYRLYDRKKSGFGQNQDLDQIFEGVIEKLDHDKLKFSERTSPRFDLDLSRHLQKLSKLAISLYRRKFVSLKFNKNPPW